MKKFLFALIAAFVSFSIPANSGDDTTSLEDVVYIRDADTGKLAYIIYEDIIAEIKDPANVYAIDGKYVIDPISREKIYELYGRYVKNYKTGKRVFIIGDGYIRDFYGGKKLYTIEGKSNYKLESNELVYIIGGVDNDKIYDGEYWTGPRNLVYSIGGADNELIYAL